MSVDITDKPNIIREALAEGILEVKPSTLELISKNMIEKGNVIETARLAAIIGVKKTPSIIPHTHPLPITGTRVTISLEPPNKIRVKVHVKTIYKTGVEMEALTGVTSALLTIWDMVKKYEKNEEGQYPHTRITEIRVIKKIKGEHK